MTRRALLLTAAVALTLLPGGGNPDATRPLGGLVAESEFALTVRAGASDRGNAGLDLAPLENLKGEHPKEPIPLRVRPPREWGHLAKWAASGDVGVLFRGGDWAALFAHGEWLWFSPHEGVWELQRPAPALRQTFAGPAARLARLTAAMVRGEDVEVPCLDNAGKPVRLRASLRVGDLDPKRDRAGDGLLTVGPFAGVPGFDRRAELTLPERGPRTLALVDFAGDDRPDVCVSTPDGVRLFANDGDGFTERSLPGLTGGARSAVWADHDGDGRADALLSTPSGPRLFSNTGAGFRDDSAGLPERPYWDATTAVWLDADGDGKADAAVADGYHGIRLLRNTRTADRRDGAPEWSDWFTVGPFASDGPTDLARVHPPEKGVSLDASYPGKGNRTVSWEKAEFPDGQVHALNRHGGDGDSNATVYLYREIRCPAPVEVPAWFGSDDSLAVWLNGREVLRAEGGRAAGPDQDKATLRLKAGPNQLLLKVVQGHGEWGFFFRAGEPTASGGATFADVSDAWGLGVPLPGRVESLSAVDADGDGRSDLVAAATGGHLFRNTGTAFERVAGHGLESVTGADVLAWADFDGDGKPDCVAAGPAGCRLFRNAGGRFEPVADTGELAKAGPANSVAWGDVDEDGNPDLLVACGGAWRTFTGLGDGRFAERADAPVAGKGGVALTADLDFDGRLDAVRACDVGPVEVLYGDPRATRPNRGVVAHPPAAFRLPGASASLTGPDGKARRVTVGGGEGRGAQPSNARFAVPPGDYVLTWEAPGVPARRVPVSVAGDTVRIGGGP